jgi:uncharacterized protein YxjI
MTEPQLTTDVVPYLTGDTFIVDQPFTMFVNTYFVSTPADDRFTPGEVLAFCRQKAFALKEDLRFHPTETSDAVLFRIKARRTIDIGGRYNVTDAEDVTIGALERRARQSLFRTTWGILDAQGTELAYVQERSVAAAVFRRIQNVLQFIPIIGWAADVVLDLIPIPYHFDIWRDGERIGHQTRKHGIRDRYRLEITGDPERRIDRRLVIAMGVALDALQSR